SSAPAGASLDATLRSGAPRPLNLTFDPASGRFAVTGAADPLALMAAMGLLDADAGAEDDPAADPASLDALATADFTGRWTGVGLAELAGGIELDLTEPIALSSSLVGNGSSLEVSVAGGTGELPLSASGTLDLSDLAALTGDEGPGLDVTLGPLT